MVDSFDLGEEHSVIEVEAAGHLLGSLADLRLPNRFGVQVIAVHRSGDVVVSPGADYALRDGDNVVVIGSNESITRFREHLDE